MVFEEIVFADDPGLIRKSELCSRGGNTFRKLRLGENDDLVLEPAHALKTGEIVLCAAREPGGRVGPLGPILPADVEKCRDDGDRHRSSGKTAFLDGALPQIPGAIL